MDKINTSSISEKKVSALFFQGFDVVVKTTTNETITLVDGLSDVLFLKQPLFDSKGIQLSQAKILDMLGLNNLGLDSIFLKDLLVNDHKSSTYNDNDNDNDNEEKISALIKEQKNLQSKVQDLQSKTQNLDNEQQLLEQLQAKQLVQSDNSVPNIDDLAVSYRQEKNVESSINVDKNINSTLSNSNKSNNSDQKIDNSLNDSSDMNVPSDTIGNIVDTKKGIFISAELSASSDSGISDNDNITNQSSLELLGSSLPEVTIELTIGNSVYYTTTDTEGNWKISDIPRSEDGILSYIAKALDSQGNHATTKGSVNIDTLVSSNSASLDVQDDSGISNLDGITNVTRPKFSGQTEPNSQIEFSFNGKEYFLTSDGQGQWFWIPSQDLLEGNYAYDVSVTDIAGNTSTVSGNICIDRTAPKVPTFDLANVSDTGILGDGITVDSTPTIVGTAEPGSTVYLSINGEEYSSYADNQGKWLINLNHIPTGIYNYEVKAIDDAGNESYTSSKTLEIRSSLSVGNIYEVYLENADDTGISDTDGVTNISLPTFSGSGPIDGNVQFIINGISYTTTVSKNGTWSIKLTTPLNEGVNNYNVIISEPDISSNTSNMNGNVYFDSQAPVMNNIHLVFDDGFDQSDFKTSVLDNKISGIGEAYSTIELKYKNQTFSTTADENGSWEIPIILASGNSKLSIQATDLAGNIDKREIDIATGTITSDHIKSVTLISDTGVKNDWGTNNSSPIIQILSVPNTLIEVKLGNTNVSLYGNSGDDGICNFEVPATLLDSKNIQNLELTIKSTSEYGDSQSQKVTIHYLKQDITFTHQLADYSDTGVKGDNITSISSPNIEGIVSGNPNTSYTGEILFDGTQTPFALSFSLVNSKIVWSFDNSSKVDLNSGENNYRITIRDSFGNETSQTGTIIYSDLKIRLTAATDSGTQDDFVTNISAPSIQGIGDPGEVVNVIFLGKTITTMVDSEGKWSIDLNSSLTGSQKLLDQAYSFTVTTVLNGITTVQNETFTYDSIVSEATVDKLMLSESRSYFSGKGEVNSRIIVTLDNKVYETSVDKEGNWKLPITNLPADGDYALQISQIDPAGNISATTDYTATVDNSPPELYLTYNDQRLEYNGSDFHGLLFEGNPRTLYGYATPGSSILLIYSYRAKGAIADENGLWVIDTSWPTSLGDYHGWTLRATSPSGEVVEIKGKGYAFDDPNISDAEITAKLDISSGVGINSNSTTPTFEGSTQPYAKVIVTLEGHQFESYADINGQWSLTIPEYLNLQSGNSYEYSVESYHLLDGSSVGPEIMSTVFIDVPPVPVVEIDPIHDTGFSDTDNITNDVLQKLYGTTESGTLIEISINGTNYQQTYHVVVDSTGTWQQNITLPSDGEFTYSATFTFPNNAVQVANGNFTIDYTSPLTTIALDVSSDTGILGDGITSTQQPVITGKSNEGNTIIELVSIDGNAVPSVTVTSSPSGYWKLSIPHDLSEGTHTYEIKITDIAGNSSTVVGNVEIDLSLDESIPFTARLDNNVQLIENSTNNDQPLFRGTAPVGAKVYFNINGDVYTTVPSSFGNWSFIPPVSLKDGLVVYDVYYVDSAGHASSTISSSFYVDTEVALSKATISDDTNSGDLTDQITNITEPTLQGYTDAGAQIIVEINNNAYQTVADSLGNWSISLPTLYDGLHDYIVYATDKLGNQNSVTGTITIDTVAPIATSLLENSVDVNGTIWINNDTPSFHGTSDPDSIIKIRIDNGAEQTLSVDSNGNWRFDSTNPLSDGVHQYEVTAVDAAGNSRTESYQFTVDT
ncbi:Ig-like domain repeat protein, partial [Vibrio fluvialis]|nr:Ig-like domain repeat protein [Vibrio fluvialis]